jgi:hypothetical protein
MRAIPEDLSERTLHERGEEFYLYGEEQKAKPAATKLAELGWSSRLDVTGGEVTAPEEDTAEPDPDVDRDPVARWIGSFDMGSVTVMTAAEIFGRGGRIMSQDPVPPDWPADTREVHERLRVLAPILRTIKCNHPYFEGDTFPCEVPPDTREGYVHVEYWAKKDSREEEGLWVFAVHEPGEPTDREEIEAYVWWNVKPREQVVEHFLELPGVFDSSG